MVHTDSLNLFMLLQEYLNRRSVKLIVALTGAVFLVGVQKNDFFSLLRITSDPIFSYFFLLGALLWFTFSMLIYKKQTKCSITTVLKRSAVILFPALLLLTLLINTSTRFHYLFHLATTAYWIFCGSIIVCTYINSKNKQRQTIDDRAHTQTHPLTYLALGFLLVTHFYFGIYNLGKEIYVDERLWFEERIEQYWDNIAERDWKHVRPSDKPGVTVALLTGPSLLFTDPSEILRQPNSRDLLTTLFFSLRLPFVLFSTLSLILFYYILNKISGRKVALLSTIFIGLSPPLLGMSRIINPDALIWIGIPITLLAFIYYLFSQSRAFLLIAGTSMGLALLTKYIANILFVFFIPILYLVAFRQSRAKEAYHLRMRALFAAYGIFVLISILVFTTLFPGTWVKYDRILLGTIESQAFGSFGYSFLLLLLLLLFETYVLKNKISYTVVTHIYSYARAYTSAIFIIFSIGVIVPVLEAFFPFLPFSITNTLLSPKSSYAFSGLTGIFISNFHPLIFGIGIFVSLGILIAIIRLYTRQLSSKQQFLLLVSIGFILVYYIGSAISQVASTTRYQIAVFPFILIISAIGFASFRKARFFSALVIIALLSGIVSLWNIRPYYLSYSNALLPPHLIANHKQMGEGNYSAAQYLNTLPNAKNLIVWSDKSGVCEFFIGLCYSGIGFEELARENVIARANYYVVSSDNQERIGSFVLQRHSYNPDYLARFDLLYPFQDTEWIIHPAGREANYVKIISASKIDISYEQDPHKPEL